MPQNLKYFWGSVHTLKKLCVYTIFYDRTVVPLNLKLKTMIMFRSLNAKRLNKQSFPKGEKQEENSILAFLKGAKVFSFAPYL